MYMNVVVVLLQLYAIASTAWNQKFDSQPFLVQALGITVLLVTLALQVSLARFSWRNRESRFVLFMASYAFILNCLCLALLPWRILMQPVLAALVIVVMFRADFLDGLDRLCFGFFEKHSKS